MDELLTIIIVIIFLRYFFSKKENFGAKNLNSCLKCIRPYGPNLYMDACDSSILKSCPDCADTIDKKNNKQIVSSQVNGQLNRSTYGKRGADP